jgi:hypothetical protein
VRAPADGTGYGLPMRAAVLLAFALLLGACAFMHEQVAITSSSQCIRQNCRDPDAADYARCETACREHYGK